MHTDASSKKTVTLEIVRQGKRTTKEFETADHGVEELGGIYHMDLAEYADIQFSSMWLCRVDEPVCVVTYRPEYGEDNLGTDGWHEVHDSANGVQIVARVLPPHKINGTEVLGKHKVILQNSKKMTEKDALNLIDAGRYKNGYAYYAEETDEWVAFSAEDLRDLVEYMNDPDLCDDAYSHWACGVGHEITDPAELAEITG